MKRPGLKGASGDDRTEKSLQNKQKKLMQNVILTHKMVWQKTTKKPQQIPVLLWEVSRETASCLCELKHFGVRNNRSGFRERNLSNKMRKIGRKTLLSDSSVLKVETDLMELVIQSRNQSKQDAVILGQGGWHCAHSTTWPYDGKVSNSATFGDFLCYVHWFTLLGAEAEAQSAYKVSECTVIQR